MAQDFERTITKDISASLTDIRATSNSDDAIVGLRLANTSASTITADVVITDNSNAVLGYIIKNAPIPQGSSLEFMSGNKVVLETADTITVNSDTNNSIDASLTIMEIT